MMTSVLSKIGCAALLFSIMGAAAACSDDDKTTNPPATTTDGGGGGGGGGGNGCGGLCKAAGFTDGTEMDFKPVVECQCSGTGGEVTKAPCEAYCSKFGVSADKSLLSAENAAKPDKCVCDGT